MKKIEKLLYLIADMEKMCPSKEDISSIERENEIEMHDLDFLFAAKADSATVQAQMDDDKRNKKHR